MVEFRVYYDDKGNILCYTCEELEGNYLVIDSETYAAARPELKVIDGELVKLKSVIRVSKLIPADKGTKCTKENIGIVVSDEYDSITVWNKKEYEFRYN